jgi:hypothetical protein
LIPEVAIRHIAQRSLSVTCDHPLTIFSIAAISRQHIISIMAEVAKVSSAADGTAQKARPEKPDQAKYEADLAAAQKEHNANMDKFVCPSFIASTPQKQIV